VQKPDNTDPDVRWFAWWEVHAAFAHGRAGGIALHRFRYDLRRFGLGPRDPACHILSTNAEALIAFAARLGLPEARIQPPRPYRPDIWHFDAFGPVLERLEAAYPPPPEVLEPRPRSGRGTQEPDDTDQ
jgi:hypothetical protein